MYFAIGESVIAVKRALRFERLLRCCELSTVLRIAIGCRSRSAHFAIGEPVLIAVKHASRFERLLRCCIYLRYRERLKMVGADQRILLSANRLSPLNALRGLNGSYGATYI